MPEAEKVLSVATAEIGTKENPPHSNDVKYNTAYYNRAVSGDAYPWCCAFVWWVFQKAGFPKLFYSGGKTASCTMLYNFYKAKGQTVSVLQAQPGDLVFFRFSAVKAGIMEHIGICESCTGGFITTIDGNTGTDNETNGGEVMRRRRELKYVGGVARPVYQEEIDVTKEELQAMVKQAVEAELSARDAAAAQAAQKVSPWAAEAWEKASGKGLFDGTNPGAALTREQAAVVLERMK